jgi:hypothetical protein
MQARDTLTLCMLPGSARQVKKGSGGGTAHRHLSGISVIDKESPG